MALNSTEIKRLLQPMKDFAPAILRCAEIVEAAEQAELLSKQYDAKVDVAKKELASLVAQREEVQRDIHSLHKQVEQARQPGPKPLKKL